MKTFSHQFKHIISDIKLHGEVSKPRDLEVTELLYAGYQINPKEPFANFTSMVN